MEYSVNFTRRADRDLYRLFDYLNTSHSPAARRWFDGLVKAIVSLERFPLRCPHVPNARKTGRPVRHFLYGSKPNVYRVLFEVDESSKIVSVLTIRHGLRDEWNPKNRLRTSS